MVGVVVEQVLREPLRWQELSELLDYRPMLFTKRWVLFYLLQVR